jgi:uncharacterized membrane protein YfcA
LTAADTWILVAVVIIVYVAALFQASIGFGANVIAQPLILLIEPSLEPGSILFTNALLSCLVMARDRQAIDRAPFRRAVGGLLLGTTIGVLIIRTASPETLALVIAICILAMVGLLAVDRIVAEPTTRNVAAAAAIGGFAGTTAGIGGPPMALLYRNADGATMRGSLGGYFMFSSSVVLTGLAIAGRFGWSEALAGFALFPVAALAFLSSHRLLPWVDNGIARPAILISSATSAAILLVRALA